MYRRLSQAGMGSLEAKTHAHRTRGSERVKYCGLRDPGPETVLRMTLLLFLATCFLAYSNGANDNFKGVASLFGSQTTSYRVAVGWATVTTFSGSIFAIFLSQALLRAFSGKGLVPDKIVGSEHFLP